MQKPAYLVVNLENNKVIKCPLTKDETYLGTDPSCDIVLDQPYLGDKYAVILKKGDYYVIKALTDKGVVISGERFYEKILEKGDYSGIGNLRAEFFPQGFETKDEEHKFNTKHTKRLVALSLLLMVIVYISGNLFLKIKENILKQRTEAILTIKKRAAVKHEKRKLSEQELIKLIAEVRKGDIIAEKFINESNVNPHNYVYAVNEWFAALRKLEYTDAPPKITAEIIEKTAKAREKVRKIVKYLQNNTFIAHQQDDDTSLKYLLENIIAMIDNPADEDYVWAKKKYINLITAKKGEKKK